MTELTDVELAVKIEIAGINLFGFDTYKHENRDRADKFRKELDELNAEAARRGLSTLTGGLRADLAAAAEQDPRVVALSERNRRFIHSRM